MASTDIFNVENVKHITQKQVQFYFVYCILVIGYINKKMRLLRVRQRKITEKHHRNKNIIALSLT